jgi:hypothetical protein
VEFARIPLVEKEFWRIPLHSGLAGGCYKTPQKNKTQRSISRN